MTDNLNLSLIVATDKFKGLARNGNIPWYEPEDLKYFRTITSAAGNNAVIMGRTTYMTIPEKYRPLANRTNIVISSTWEQKDYPDIIVVNDFEALFDKLKNNNYSEIFVIGGEQIYRTFLSKYNSYCSKIYLTILNKDYHCDQFFLYNEAQYKVSSYNKLSFGERLLLEHK